MMPRTRSVWRRESQPNALRRTQGGSKGYLYTLRHDLLIRRVEARQRVGHNALRALAKYPELLVDKK